MSDHIDLTPEELKQYLALSSLTLNELLVMASDLRDNVEAAVDVHNALALRLEPQADEATLEQRADALDIHRAPCEDEEDFEARVEQEEVHVKNCATPTPYQRKSVATDENIAAVRDLIEAGETGVGIASKTGLTTTQVYHIVKTQGLSLRKTKAPSCLITHPTVKSAPISELEIRERNRALIVAATRKIQGGKPQ